MACAHSERRFDRTILGPQLHDAAALLQAVVPPMLHGSLLLYCSCSPVFRSSSRFAACCCSCASYSASLSSRVTSSASCWRILRAFRRARARSFQLKLRLHQRLMLLVSKCVLTFRRITVQYCSMGQAIVQLLIKIVCVGPSPMVRHRPLDLGDNAES